MTPPTLRDRWLLMSADEKATYQSGLVCAEPDCNAPAGTPWGPYWCPMHDDERLDRITRSLERMAKRKTK